MEEDLRALLLGRAAVTDFAGDRIVFGRLPQGSLMPGVRMTVISDVDEYYLDGPAGLTRSRVQVDCFAATYRAAKLLSRRVRDVLSGHTDAQFGGIFLSSALDVSDGGTNEVEAYFGVSLDFEVHYCG